MQCQPTHGISEAPYMFAIAGERMPTRVDNITTQSKTQTLGLD